MVFGGALGEFMEKLEDCEGFHAQVRPWMEAQVLEGDRGGGDVVFTMDELRELDHALDGFAFDHILRMPPDRLHGHDRPSESLFTLNDFMYSAAHGLWKRFWSYGNDESFPFYIVSKHALQRFTRRNGCRVGALATKEACSGDLSWENVLMFFLIHESDESIEESLVYEPHPSSAILSEAVLFAMRVLIARKLTQSGSNALTRMAMDTAYVLFVEPCPGGVGGVVRVQGDVNELKTNTDMVYQSASGWLQHHADLAVSRAERIWNRFGSVNWRDVGALQLLLATFCCLEQCLGSSKDSIASIASRQRLSLDRAMRERKLYIQENLFSNAVNLHWTYGEVEIEEADHSSDLEVDNKSGEVYSSGYVEEEKSKELDSSSHVEDEKCEEEANPSSQNFLGCMEVITCGAVLWLVGGEKPKRGYKILEPLSDDRQFIYKATPVGEKEGKPNLVNVYVEAHPTQLEPSWEDMSSWYQVQRQARVLSLMKQKGLLSSKHFPKLIDSGKLLYPYKCSKRTSKDHPGHDWSKETHKDHPGRDCSKETRKDHCDHPFCGTHILVTAPIGDSLSSILRNQGSFAPKEMLGCCYDCLTALQSAHRVGIQHANITPDHILRITERGETHHVLIEWGHAILEEKDTPHLSLNYSSTDVLQEGRVYPVSDVESLVYVLFSLSGGTTPHFENIESALQWRVRAWARRAIQEVLGEASIILKAFADYVNNLYRTPYPVDYDIWLNRIARALQTM